MNTVTQKVTVEDPAQYFYAPYSLCPGISKRARHGLSLDNMGPYKPNRCHLSLVTIFPELGFLFRDTKHVCICLPLSVTLKAQISAFFLPESPRRKQSKDDTVKETANTSSEKMTTVARYAYRQNACRVTSLTSSERVVDERTTNVPSLQNFNM